VLNFLEMQQKEYGKWKYNPSEKYMKYVIDMQKKDKNITINSYDAA